MQSRNPTAGRTANSRGQPRKPRRQPNQPPIKATGEMENTTVSDREIRSDETDLSVLVNESSEVLDESSVCFICAERVKFWSVSECNHRTCHVCALRLRALYKRMDCTFCKVGVHSCYLWYPKQSCSMPNLLLSSPTPETNLLKIISRMTSRSRTKSWQ